MIGFDIKRMFFDRQAVISKVDAATRRVLSKFGAFVRRSAKSSIRKRKKPAPPGQPPSSHTGLLKKFIFFGYDADRRSVVIGPTRLNQKGRGEAPPLLEYGGKATLVRRGKKKRVTYQARPYMGPAFEKEKPQLPAMWRGSVR
ncbi:MAG TPA: hypothetical protein P5279_09985 [Anaerohalosphaeraceae bacterium]|jgi:hypothetical protein|nr:hypothetical protein [Anaerohalosphaeraceae bacterium]HRT86848.1 hypothetical protein [Anaerohalosphaeraceae bacterium]